MDTSQYNTLCLQLILILLIGLSINVCVASEVSEALIEEAAEPLVVTILDSWSDGPAVPARSDAEILANRILERETADFYFDLPQRNRLIGEIEGVLSLIRAAYPLMNEIHAIEWSAPGTLTIYLEPDLYEIVKEMLQDKEGQIRFATGNAEFDALNAKLGVQAVILGGDFFKSLDLYFDRGVNLRVAIEAYSKVEGVRREFWRNAIVGDSDDIKAFKQGETWYVIFRHGWGDCPGGCIYEELFCFTVRGTAVAMIPTAQAQTMPPFQGLGDEGDWERHNRTPFFNATAHSWSWRDSLISGGTALDGLGLGCSLFGEIDATPDQLRVSCGYRVESLPREDIDDYDFTGVVLLLIATQERTVIDSSRAYSSVVASEAVLAAKTAAEIEHPENIYFENVLMPINPPPPSAPFERWWGGVHPTFIVCWDHPETGWRSYQFLEPNIMHASSDAAKNQHGCDKIRDTDYIQTLDVSSPPLVLRTMFMKNMKKLLGVSMLPDSDNWRDWVDEVLPRPAAPE